MEQYKIYHEQLPKRIRTWLNDRKISNEIIDRFFLGWNGRALTVPIFDMDGNFSFFKYRKDPVNTNEDMPRYWYDKGHSYELYGWENIRAGLTPLVICEGELDRLCLENNAGIAGVTSTGGCEAFKEEWAQMIPEDVNVYICCDNDKNKAGQKAAIMIAGFIPQAKIINLPRPEEEEKIDITDYFTKLGKSKEDFLYLMRDAQSLPLSELKEQKKEEDEELIDSLRELTPAQDFRDAIAYVSMPLPILKEKKVENVVYIITSNKEKFRLNDEELFKRGFYTTRHPYPDARWSSGAIRKFLESEKRIDIVWAFNLVKSRLEHYIDFGDENWHSCIACWIVGTYFHRLFESYPYVYMNGDAESGKTKTLTLCSLLAFNGELTFNSTPSYITSAIHENSASCFVDEAERLKDSSDPSAQIVVSMMNGGYKKGAFCGKQESAGGKKWKPRKFEAYSPKMFANIKGLDPVLLSRCVPIVMGRTADKEISNREINISAPVFQEIRDMLYAAMMQWHGEIADAYQALSDSEILGREWELWKPIFAIAKVISEEFYQQFRMFALGVQQEKKEALLDTMTAPRLLQALIAMIEEYERKREEEFQWDQISFGETVVEEKLKKQGLPFFSNEEIVGFLQNYDPDFFGWLGKYMEKKKNFGRWLGNELRKAKIIKGQAQVRKEAGQSVRGHCLDKDLIQKRLKGYTL